MGQLYRLPTGGRIDRTRPVRFSFDGNAYVGFAGDTLASALLANGVRMVGRSFKYHRPRGVMGLAFEEPNALVGVARASRRHDPNVRATTQELFEGLIAESQNCWPSLRWDLGAGLGAFASVLSAGFYYKTFMWPPQAWSAVYEPMLRKLAGLGRAPRCADPDIYSSKMAHFDVLVVGGGLAGICAALAAAKAGGKVLLCDENAELGGALLSRKDLRIARLSAWTWLEQQRSELDRHGVAILSRTTAYGYFADNMVGLCERLTDHLAAPIGPRERLWLVRARSVILATGAIERPIVFRNNDRPGVMLASAAAGYAVRYGVLPGRRAIICTACDQGYESALALADAGANVLVADARAAVRTDILRTASARGVEVRTGVAPADTKGGRAVTALALATARGSPTWVSCDLVGMAGGSTPSLHLHSQSGGRTYWSPAHDAFLPDPGSGQALSVGACTGTWGVGESLSRAEEAGRTAAKPASGRPKRAASPRSMATSSSSIATPPEPPSRRPLQAATAAWPAFVDFQHDVTTKDILLAIREGFSSIEHIKRYTTTGMATDQGRTSNMNALRIAATALERTVPEVGHTSYRQPYTPVTFGALAGRNRGPLFDPLRRTPIDGWAEAHGAVFENVGLWRRARYFPRSGEDMRAAVSRECLATRRAAGLFDASTLGKIEVVGPDAAEFMNRLYVNAWGKLEPGRCRYGVMLKEDGFVLDDGVVGRLAEDRFHVTTTTTGAHTVLHHMEDYLQTEFPHLQVWLTSTTEQWGVIAINGPAAREIIAPLVQGIDFSTDAFPHMSVRNGRICGAPCRLFRVSFTGELGFEINVPTRVASRVWEAVHRAGQPLGLSPYGTEAMHVLRAEKGYIIVGQETDGTVTADDLGLGWSIGKRKVDFVGQRSLRREGLCDPDRLQLVGLVSRDRNTVLEEGAQVIRSPDAREPLGHVTSAYWSATLGEPIALALIAGGRARIGEKLAATSLVSAAIPVEVVAPVFFDPTGTRLDG